MANKMVPAASDAAPVEDDSMKYDVAISFLSRDEPIATPLYDRLSDGLRVFFYPRSQEALAGTDGLDSMRRPFVDESRVVVVLYREPWGNTEWTRVEETAIKDRCLKHGWESLFFMTLDKGAKLPKWLPRTHVRLSYENFGLEQAVGAIKARVQELGGEIVPVNAETRAKLVQAEAKYLAERKDCFSSLGWIKENVYPTLREACTEIERLCRRLDVGLNVKAGAAQTHCVMTDGRVSVAVVWVQPYSNIIDAHVYLAARRFRGRVALPDERFIYPFGGPKPLGETRFSVELSRTRELRWAEDQKSETLMTTSEVADKCVRIFLDLVQKANRGEINFDFDIDDD